MTERSVAARVHGRYLAIPPAIPGPAPMLIGFHGYGEDAESQLERLRGIPGSDHWLVVSIQALYRFYDRRTNRVVANWMTRQDREAAIADNLAYVRTCIEVIGDECQTLPVIVFAGFSQGVAMAFRAAVHARNGASVIAVGGDVPPEITCQQLQRVPSTLLARGTFDELYSAEQFAKDQRRIRDCSRSVRVVTLNAGHTWAEDLVPEAAAFLADRYPV